MKKKLLTVFVIFQCLMGLSQQPLNNSWIDYSKTYYKFKITANGLYRIPQTAFPSGASDLIGANGDQFQLWRNGKQIRIYTSVLSTPFSANDFIEFWGEMNDGKPDKYLYRDTLSQLNDKKSLFSDTAAYFLTVNSNTANNLRYLAGDANIPPNLTPIPDNFCLVKQEQSFTNQINLGWYQTISLNLYLSDFDLSEGWTSSAIGANATSNFTLNNANVYSGADAPSVFTFAISGGGNTNSSRVMSAGINNSTNILPANDIIQNFDYRKDTITNLPLSLLTGSPSSIKVNIQNTNSSNGADQLILGAFSVTYPATFDFYNQSSFYFELPASANSYDFLNISNFNCSSNPILYDITGGNRYSGVLTSVAGQVQFYLPASTTNRKFLLISQDGANLSIISSLTKRNFLDLTNTANQGNYIIISNPVLYDDGTGVNNVNLYKEYRSTPAGGGYNAKVYDINELTDQFGFGIYSHPSSIRDFIQYAIKNFSTTPQHTLIIGRGVNYIDFYNNKANPAAVQLNLVPTFGWPSSDVLLVAAPSAAAQLISVGRIGAVNGAEVGYYLQKVKEYEQVQQSPVQTFASKGWMKNMVFLGGSHSTYEAANFNSYLTNFYTTAIDTSFGAHGEIYINSSDNNIQNANQNRLTQLFNIGLGNLTYFGHADANALAFNINTASYYNNQGKYPFINISGCDAGDYYNFSSGRLNGNLSLSESYTFTKQSGSIGFLAGTFLGLENNLFNYNVNLFKDFCQKYYGGTVGAQLKQNNIDLGGNISNTDQFTRMALEQMNLQGDPAIKFNTFSLPDYDVEPQLIKINPSLVSVADTTFSLNINYYNLGKGTNDSIRIIVNRILPNGNTQSIYNTKRLAPKNADSLINISVKINPLTDTGLNKIIVILDADNAVSEITESNNTAEYDFTIYENVISPVFPYNYAIVNTLPSNLTFTASTSNPLIQNRQYIMELDTTALFNSTLKQSYNVTGNGGEIEFKPANFTFTDNTVYYWRTSIIPTGTDTTIWKTFSFTYLSSSSSGFNQGHYYQNLPSTLNNITYDNDRTWKFAKTAKQVIITNGVFPTASSVATDFSVGVNGNISIQSVCGVGKIIINAFDPYGFSPIPNVTSGTTGLYGSELPCGSSRRWNFQYDLGSQAARIAAVNFLNTIPDGYYVTVRNTEYSVPGYGSFASTWLSDTAILGSGKSLYNSLKNAGFAQIDSFYFIRAFNFIYKKNDPSFGPSWAFSVGATDKVSLTANCPSSELSGTMASPIFGPAKTWNQFHFNGHNIEQNSTDSITFQIVGISPNGTRTPLYTLDSTNHDFDISAINATQYPYIQLNMFSYDSINGSPYQLNYWRLNYTPVPEGAIAPNQTFVIAGSNGIHNGGFNASGTISTGGTTTGSTTTTTSAIDTVKQGALVDIKVAFKNVSPVDFTQPMQYNLIVTDHNNVQNIIPIANGKILAAGDTLNVSYTLNTQNFPGNNTIYLDVNPGGIQPEQYSFNNSLTTSLYVIPTPLPLSIVDFTASLNGTNCTLTWVTTDETGIQSYDIERSLDGGNSYQKIGNSLAKGFNTNNYTWYDNLANQSGKVFYRLKINSLNNAAKYSQTRLVVLSSSAAPLQVLPNPFVGTLTIVDYSKNKESLNIKVVSMDGKNVFESNILAQKGSNVYRLDLSNISNGIYILHITHSDGTVETSKIIKSGN